MLEFLDFLFSHKCAPQSAEKEGKIENKIIEG
jgi:hypothetical protein